jgi:hypothetical protein
MQKIDFFGGLHGNFLELVVNVAINQNGYDISKPQFTPDGACHLKDQDNSYTKMIVAKHWSFDKRHLGPDDQIVRIVPTSNDMLIGITNTFLRAGDQKFDIDNLEKDLLNKMSKLGKGIKFKNTVVNDHGVKVDYPRSVIRNYFYSMFDDHDNGLGMFTQFDTTPTKVHYFPFRAFFDIGYFYQELDKIARFLGLNFYPTTALGNLHAEFLALNQGLHSEIKCKQVWQNILHGKPANIQLNLIEEAWINHQVATCFRCYDLPLLSQDQYPTDTLEISKAVFAWKAQDYHTSSNS